MSAMQQDGFSALDRAVQRFDPLWAKHYDAAVDRGFEPPVTTIKQTMIDLMDRAACDPLIYFEDQVIARKEADEQANRLGNALLSLGLEKGERVSLIVSNRPEIIYGFMACYKTGLVAAAFNQRCTSFEICGSIDTVSSSAVIIEQQHADKVLDALRAGKCPSVRAVVVLDRPEGLPDSAGAVRICRYGQLLADASANELPVKVQPSDNAILLFTGGTTGVSKGVCATQGDMVREIKTMHHWAAPALTNPDPSVLICMPLTHIWASTTACIGRSSTAAAAFSRKACTATRSSTLSRNTIPPCGRRFPRFCIA